MCHIPDPNVPQVGMGLQELLISVEMMFVSVACHYIFSYYPYRPPKGRSLPSSMIVSHAVSPRVMVKVPILIHSLLQNFPSI